MIAGDRANLLDDDDDDDDVDDRIFDNARQMTFA